VCSISMVIFYFFVWIDAFSSYHCGNRTYNRSFEYMNTFTFIIFK
jgi:hypothetical protein